MGIPAFLQEMLSAQYGGKLAEKITNGMRRRSVSFRVNTLKTNAVDAKRRLENVGIPFREIGWYADAMTTDVTESALAATDLYQRGEIYLQSLSSMLPPLILNAKAGDSVLDMTAAPGGKTTQISALSEGKALITACEKDKIRFERLKYNVAKQGAPRVTLINSDALKLDHFFRFDKILLDAPCSGSGTLEQGQKNKISPQLIQNSAKLQEALLRKALALLKRGGEVVYSTCSVLKQENEEILERVLPGSGGELVPILPLGDEETLPSLRGTLCVCPNDFYEGFFLAKIRKI